MSRFLGVYPRWRGRAVLGGWADGCIVGIGLRSQLLLSGRPSPLFSSSRAAAPHSAGRGRLRRRIAVPLQRRERRRGRKSGTGRQTLRRLQLAGKGRRRTSPHSVRLPARPRVRSTSLGDGGQLEAQMWRGGGTGGAGGLDPAAFRCRRTVISLDSRTTFAGSPSGRRRT